MLKLKYAVLLLVVFVPQVFAADSKPSDESIRQLLAVTETRKLLDNMMGQIDGMMKNGMQQELHGQTITPDQQKIIDGMRPKIVALLKQELTWESLEPFYMRTFRDSFTQEEVDGMLAFYKTPAGQAVIKKMPLVMQSSMVEMQKRMGSIFPKLQKLEQETLAELKAQATDSTANKPIKPTP